MFECSGHFKHNDYLSVFKCLIFCDACIFNSVFYFRHWDEVALDDASMSTVTAEEEELR